MGVLTGKTALVTGASRGIGKTIALDLAASGAKIIAVDVLQDQLNETQSEFAQKDFQYFPYVCDVGDYEKVEEFHKKVKQDHGSIDILVNNAGITRDGLIMRMKKADWDSVIHVNLTGVFNLCKIFSRMLMKSAGTIVNISSVIGVMGNAGQVNYSASKAGVIGITKSLAKELCKKGVRVNAVAPGYIQTAMTDKLSEEVKEEMLKNIPLGKLGAPEDVSKVVSFLVGPDSAYMTGQVLIVDGGMCI